MQFMLYIVFCKIEKNQVRIGLLSLSDHPSVKRITPHQIVQRTIHDFSPELNKTESDSTSRFDYVSARAYFSCRKDYSLCSV